MKIITKYVIAEAKGTRELEANVAGLIEQGFVPLGSVSNDALGQAPAEYKFYQAMVLYSE